MSGFASSRAQAEQDAQVEPTFFQLEREKLIGDISENLGKLIAGVNGLNRKTEANIAVGSEFEGVSRLWSEYHRVMANSGEEKVPSNLPLLGVGQRDGQRQDDSFDLAPGGGSTSYYVP